MRETRNCLVFVIWLGQGQEENYLASPSSDHRALAANVYNRLRVGPHPTLSRVSRFEPSRHAPESPTKSSRVCAFNSSVGSIWTWRSRYYYGGSLSPPTTQAFGPSRGRIKENLGSVRFANLTDLRKMTPRRHVAKVLRAGRDRERATRVTYAMEAGGLAGSN